MHSAAELVLPHQTPRARSALLGDDVVFMYPAEKPATYTEYGCTFLAWGGAKDGESVRRLGAMGIHSTGTLWCLTAGAESCHKNADLRDAVCRDIQGRPVLVWWLFDATFEGTPTWFGCTNHPAFRAFVRQRVAEEMRGGAPGLHVDDHLGTAHSVAFLGGCFCDHCMAAFRTWLTEHGTPEATKAAGVTHWADFDYRDLVRRYAKDDQTYRAVSTAIPLHAEFLDCQLQLAAENVRQLGALASEIVGHPITLSANAALPELPHLAVTSQITHLVAEVPHHAEQGTAGLHEAVFAYRMAEATGKPIAATARGYDWAWVKAKGAVNLARIWIALGYCVGQRLMAPHRQWCFTLELGSHWYDAPAETYSPLYRFVREYSNLFRDTTPLIPPLPPGTAIGSLYDSKEREALRQALAEAEPRHTSVDGAWLFERRDADGALIVHLLNLRYTADDDHVEPIKALRVRLPDEVSIDAAVATLYTYDGEPMTLAIQETDGERFVVVPELRICAVVKIGHTV